MPSNTCELALTTVEWPHEDHIPAIRCPITGMVVFLGFGSDHNPDEDSPLEPADGECPTLMFRFVHGVGFEDLRPDLAERSTRRKMSAGSPSP